MVGMIPWCFFFVLFPLCRGWDGMRGCGREGKEGISEEGENKGILDVGGG